MALVYGKEYPQHYRFRDVTENNQQLASALSLVPSMLEQFAGTALQPLTFATRSSRKGSQHRGASSWR